MKGDWVHPPTEQDLEAQRELRSLAPVTITVREANAFLRLFDREYITYEGDGEIVHELMKRLRKELQNVRSV